MEGGEAEAEEKDRSCCKDCRWITWKDIREDGELWCLSRYKDGPSGVPVPESVMVRVQWPKALVELEAIVLGGSDQHQRLWLEQERSKERDLLEGALDLRWNLVG